MLAAIAAAALTAAACTEKLEGGNACPSLCPEQTLGFQDTVFTAAEVIDTFVTVPGSPPLGTLGTLMFARYAQAGDSVVTGVVFRFDSIRQELFLADTTKPPLPILTVDSANVHFSVVTPPVGQDTLYVKDSTVTFTVYDVYVNAPDLDTAAVHAKFGGTIVGQRTIRRDSLTGQIVIPIDTFFVANSIRMGKKIWLGMQVSNANGAKIVAYSSKNPAIVGALGSIPGIFFDAVANDADTAVHTHVITEPNVYPTGYGPPIPAMGDYQMFFQGSAPVPAGLVAVGGSSPSRLLVRFKFPSWLIDSSTTVVRANLELTQAPSPQFAWDSTAPDADSVTIHPYALVAAPSITDLSAQSVLVGDVTLTPMPNADRAPTASGADTLRLVTTGTNLFNYWKVQGDKIQRGVVFALTTEGTEPRQIFYYGTTAAPALRPRVHVSYVPHSIIGLP